MPPLAGPNFDCFSSVRTGVDLRHLALATSSAILVLTTGLACNPGTPGAQVHTDTSATNAKPSNPSTAPADTQHVALSVKGMYCESCGSTVTAMLRRTPGVLRADVSVERSEALVMYDSTRTSPTTLVDVISTLGYTAALKGP